MNRLHSLILSRAARATSAACFVCGALLLVKRRWHQEPHVPTFPSPTHIVVRPLSLSERLVWQWKWATSRSSDQPQDLPTEQRVNSNALRELSILTKDPTYCEHVMIRPGTVERLLCLLLESFGRLSHEVECLLAEIFANLSSRDDFQVLLKRHNLDRCLVAWSERADSARLSLCAAKIRHNIAATCSMLAGDLYLLSDRRDESGSAGVDVVFVNGINGSVFHTWRPRDLLRHSKSEIDYQTCWPRDWLAQDVVGARLFGIDVKVRAWAWNPASTNRPDQRPLVPRASRLLADVERAGVGRDRPVVWVTHSMGGLLVKELLRQAEATSSHMAKSTRGVLFMSTPHRGSTSLRPLFYFPLRLCLSVESAELSRNAEPLCGLDDWFREFAARRGVRVMDIREEKPTRVSSVYSVLLVESNGPDLGEVVSVPCDHITISKPTDRSDPIYTTVRSFVNACADA